MARRLQSVYGYQIRAPRPTYRGVGLLAAFAGPPILAVGLVLDVAVWVVAEAAFDTCVGVWCWL